MVSTPVFDVGLKDMLTLVRLQFIKAHTHARQHTRTHTDRGHVYGE